MTEDVQKLFDLFGSKVRLARDTNCQLLQLARDIQRHLPEVDAKRLQDGQPLYYIGYADDERYDKIYQLTLKGEELRITVLTPINERLVV